MKHTMRIALIGYGKMGKEIEAVAKSRGHEVVLIIDVDNLSDFNATNMAKVQVAIEFSRPDSAFEHVMKCFDFDVPVVCGTTGWTDRMQAVKDRCRDEKKSFLCASNFSLGVNIFFKLNTFLARIMNRFPEYEVDIKEIHHTQKLDAPSGTAITLAGGVIQEIDRKNGWQLDRQDNGMKIAISAIRRDKVPGTHTVSYKSEIDDIQITHTAHNRKGLALGAVLAAEYIYDKKGTFTMDDLFNI